MRLLRRRLGSLALVATPVEVSAAAARTPAPRRRRSCGSRHSAADLNAVAPKLRGAAPYASAGAARLRGGSSAPSVARNSNPADRMSRIAPTNSNVYALWASARASS